MSLTINSCDESVISVKEIDGTYHWSVPPRAEDVIALARAILHKQLLRGQLLAGTQLAVEFFQMQFSELLHEELWAVFLDNQYRVIRAEMMFRGTVDRTNVFPREIVRQAVVLGASNVMLAHNHPSGNLKPSSADCEMTKVVEAALALVEVKLTDHFIITQNGFMSFREADLLT